MTDGEYDLGDAYNAYREQENDYQQSKVERYKTTALLLAMGFPLGASMGKGYADATSSSSNIEFLIASIVASTCLTAGVFAREAGTKDMPSDELMRELCGKFDVKEAAKEGLRGSALGLAGGVAIGFLGYSIGYLIGCFTGK